jgi:tRNA/tmRNA/rRNA uracil-C5-methylase (TrmA/RlmC/RlmD family)
VTVTVIRDKKEQNLTLTLPEKKDSGSLLNSFDMPEFSAETQQAINRAADEVARMTPAIMQKVQQSGLCRKEMEKKLNDAERTLRDRQKEIQEWQEQEKEWQEKLRHELSGAWIEI